MSALAVRIPTALLLCLAAAAVALADGGTVRFSGTLAGIPVTVLTAPTPLRVGPADISVHAPDAPSSAPLEVLVRARPKAASASPATHAASRDHSSNRLFSSALVELDEEGPWEIEVEVRGKDSRGTARFEVVVLPPLPRWRDLAVWIALPILPIGLYVVVQATARRGGDPRRRERSA